MKIHSVKINGVKYDFGLLPAALQKAVTSLEFLDRELRRLNTEVEVLGTARQGYVEKLHDLVDSQDLSHCVSHNSDEASDSFDFDLSKIIK